MSKKILIGYMIGDHNSGIDRYILNFIRTVSEVEPDVQIGILSSQCETELLKELNEKEHICVHYIPSLKQPLAQIKAIKEIIRKHHYNITYFNISDCSNFCGVYASYKCRVAKRIVHSHSSNIVSNGFKTYIFRIMHIVMKPFLSSMCTDILACSLKAANWMYPKKDENRVQLIFNFIDTKKFLFDENVRREVRKENGWNHQLIVGHVANFNQVKNHPFVVDIFVQLHAMNPNSHLVLVGDGIERENIENLIKQNHLLESVSLLGIRKDVNVLLQGFDVLLLPSFNEGLPISAIEGQVSGVDCFFSDTITDEVKISDQCHFVDLKKGSLYWAQFILDHLTHRQNYDSTYFKKYDVDNQEKIFKELINK